jgi:hypothetical protein
MTKLAIRRALLGLAISVIAVACGKVAESSGGDTHWLGECDTDGDCQSGQCLCGICTNTCAGDKSCLAPGKSAACFDIDSPGVKARCAGHAPTGAKGICLATCDAKQPCGTGTSCLQGACVQASTSPDGGSAGGAGGSTASASIDASSGGTGTGGMTSTGGSRTDSGWNCYVPSNELPSSTPKEQQRSAQIHDFCVNLDESGCLPLLAGSSFIGMSLNPTCGSDKLIHACELDVEREYAQWAQSGLSCDDTWQKALTCGATATYMMEDCTSADPGITVAGSVIPCLSEHQAYSACLNTADSNPDSAKVVGSRTTCTYGPGTVSACDVSCSNAGSKYIFGLDCGGPAGVPLRCECSVNSTVLGDIEFGGRGMTRVDYASDCADAAKQAADGFTCTNRLDCCVKYPNPAAPGSDDCICGADPSELNFPTCDALAKSMNGQVVAGCPQYDPMLP